MLIYDSCYIKEQTVTGYDVFLNSLPCLLCSSGSLQSWPAESSQTILLQPPRYWKK